MTPELQDRIIARLADIVEQTERVWRERPAR